MQEALETLDLGQAAKERAASGRLQRRCELTRLDGIVQPTTLRRDLDVIEVVADRAGIDLAQVLQSCGGVRRAVRGRPANDCGRQAGEIGSGQAVKVGVKLRSAGWGRA